MKWGITVKKNDETRRTIDSIGGVPVRNLFGFGKCYVHSLVAARNAQTGDECYFVQVTGSPLCFLEQFIYLRLLQRSNMVVPYWITERERA